MQKIKLIWDFKGENTFDMATHYNKHLVEFFKSKEINLIESGINNINEHHHLTYAIIDEQDVNIVKHPLKPHRAFIVE
jgi:hypothetical protein